MRTLGCLVIITLAAACREPAIPVDGTDGTTGEPETTGGSTSSGSDTQTPDTTSSGADASSSETGMPVDMGVDLPPIPTSRLVVDQETPRGHALFLHELVDGEPRDPVQLTTDSPVGTEFRPWLLGSAERIVIDVEYSNDTEPSDLFLVDWSAGHPATVTPLDDAVPASSSLGPLTWVESLSAIVVRIGGSYYRIDIGDGGPSAPIDLLDELPFGIAFEDEWADVVMGSEPWLVVRGDAVGRNLYVASIAEPVAPVQRVTEFDDLPVEPLQPEMLAGGHLVFEVTTLPGPPEEDDLHIALRVGDGWAPPIEIEPPPDVPDARLYLIGVRPGTDEFVYLVASDEPPTTRLLLGRVEAGALAEPIVLLGEIDARQYTFSPDGSELVYILDPDDTIGVIEFTDDGPGRPRSIAPVRAAGEFLARMTITADGQWFYVEAEHATVTYYDAAILRVGLDEGAPTQVVAGEIGAVEEIREAALSPDEQVLAIARTSAQGIEVYVVDVAGPDPGEPMIADEGDAPVLDELLFSPDSHWLAATMSHGDDTDSVVITRRDHPAQAVLELTDLVAEPVWLPAEP